MCIILKGFDHWCSPFEITGPRRIYYALESLTLYVGFPICFKALYSVFLNKNLVGLVLQKKLFFRDCNKFKISKEKSLPI